MARPKKVVTPDNRLDKLEQAVNKLIDLTTRTQNDMTEKVSALEIKLAEQASKIPTFQPMEPAEGIAPHKPDWNQLTRAGQEPITGGHQMPIGSDGLRIPRYTPKFRVGDKVRINPNSEMSERLRVKKIDSQQFVGTVMGFHYVDRNWVAKYRVWIPGITSGGKRGDGIRETELVSA